MEHAKIRPATINDMPAVNDIYNHYVEHSTSTYQTEPETLEERRAWFSCHGAKHPVLVALLGDEVAAWGSLSRFHPRAAYAHTVENSIYVRHDLQGRGLGSKLLAELIDVAEKLGHRSIIACIDAAQQGSIALHRKHGFADAGRLTEVGFKFGHWLDVVYMQRMVAPATGVQ